MLTFTLTTLLQTSEQIVERVAADPLNSSIATMGMVNISTTRFKLDQLLSEWRCRYDQNLTLSNELFARLSEEEDNRAICEMAVENAKRNLDAASSKVEVTKSLIESKFADMADLKSFVDQGEVMRATLLKIETCKSEKRPFSTMRMERIRRNLRVESFGDVMALDYDIVILSLRILELFGYASNREFQRLWEVPPGDFTRNQWKDMHGRLPEVKHSAPKGCSRKQIRIRLAHYLGLVEPSNQEADAKEKLLYGGLSDAALLSHLTKKKESGAQLTTPESLKLLDLIFNAKGPVTDAASTDNGSGIASSSAVDASTSSTDACSAASGSVAAAATETDPKDSMVLSP